MNDPTPNKVVIYDKSTGIPRYVWSGYARGSGCTFDVLRATGGFQQTSITWAFIRHPDMPALRIGIMSHDDIIQLDTVPTQNLLPTLHRIQ